MHLYGIETCAVIENGWDLDVPIAPLWNWNESLALLYFAHNSSFQLHLYGIETSIIFFDFWHNIKVPIAPLWNWNTDAIRHKECLIAFQLHLYGIETVYREYLYFCVTVPIAPLWNWNEKRNLEISGFLRAFQLHLYGIETWLLSVSMMRWVCSNWTFMELKRIKQTQNLLLITSF